MLYMSSSACSRPKMRATSGSRMGQPHALPRGEITAAIKLQEGRALPRGFSGVVDTDLINGVKGWDSRGFQFDLPCRRPRHSDVLASDSLVPMYLLDHFLSPCSVFSESFLHSC